MLTLVFVAALLLLMASCVGGSVSPAEVRLVALQAVDGSTASAAARRGRPATPGPGA